MDDQALKQLAAQKEKEWLNVMQERLNALEKTVETKDELYAELNQKYTRLSEDFKYNLKLIDDRDKELATFDNRLKEMKKILNEKNSEISELKIVNDQLYTLKKQIESQIDEEKKHFLHRLSIKEKDLGNYKQQCDHILQTEREQLEQERRAINRRLTELESDLERQRRELTNEFETETKKLELDWKRRYDELTNLQLASELKSKLLTEELDQHAQTTRQLELNKSEGNERNKTLEKLVKELEWQLHEQDAVKNARIKELELKCSNVDERLQEREDDYGRKYSELDRLLREKEIKIEQLKESYQELEDKCQQATDQGLQLRQQQNEKQREHEHLIREKDAAQSALQDEINRVKKEWNHQITQLSKEHANENIEHRAQQEECDALKAELKIKENHINRYKKELEDALDRERALDEAKAQLDIDWQKKLDQNQRQEYHKSEDLIEKLSTAHEQAIAQVKKLENDIHFKDDLLKAYSNQYKSNGGDADVLVVLQRENESLRSVITQMRQQMEALVNDLPSQATSGQSNLVVELQNEVQTLRQQNRDLVSRLDSRHSNIDVDHTAVNHELKKNPQLNSYVQSLNNTIAALRTDKMQLVSQVRKLEGRLIQIEKNHDNFQKELRQRQSRIDQLTYQLNADDRRHQTELTSMKQKLGDLEVLLLETRREADEYQKSIIERNADVAELERKLSEAKLELAGRTPLFNYGGQEILIQQLQDEIERLTKKYSEVKPKMHASNGESNEDGINVNEVLLKQENEQLRRRMEQLNGRIQTLIRDKERLLEISNHLRAQVNRYEDEPVVIKRPPAVDTIPTNMRPNLPPSPKKDFVNLENKLQRLEQLQYALTKQELENRKRAHQVTNEFQQQQRPTTAPEKSENPLMNSDNTVTTIASENIRDLWKVLDNTPGKGPSIAKSSTINVNAQRKALTARTSSGTTRGGGGGGSSRAKIEIMSDVTSTSTDTANLLQRLQSAEKSIAFIQREHAATLGNLHEEITKWQQKCSELTFQLAIGGGTIINSSDESKLRATIEQLENEIHQYKDKMTNLNGIIEEKDKTINDYENRLIVNERKHAMELRLENDKYRQLKIELEQRSTLIAQLTNQLHREKQVQQQLQTRQRLGQMILPNKPAKLENTDQTTEHLPASKRLTTRSSSLNHRVSADHDLTVLLVKRRPPTPPQQLRPLSSKSIESLDEPVYTKRQRQLMNSHTETNESNRLSASRPSLKRSTLLPPIGTKTMPLKALTTAVFQQEGEV